MKRKLSLLFPAFLLILLASCSPASPPLTLPARQLVNLHFSGNDGEGFVEGSLDLDTLLTLLDDQGKINPHTSEGMKEIEAKSPTWSAALDHCTVHIQPDRHLKNGQTIQVQVAPDPTYWKRAGLTLSESRYSAQVTGLTQRKTLSAKDLWKKVHVPFQGISPWLEARVELDWEESIKKAIFVTLPEKKGESPTFLCKKGEVLTLTMVPNPRVLEAQSLTLSTENRTFRYTLPEKGVPSYLQDLKQLPTEQRAKFGEEALLPLQQRMKKYMVAHIGEKLEALSPQKLEEPIPTAWILLTPKDPRQGKSTSLPSFNRLLCQFSIPCHLENGKTVPLFALTSLSGVYREGSGKWLADPEGFQLLSADQLLDEQKVERLLHKDKGEDRMTRETIDRNK